MQLYIPTKVYSEENCVAVMISEEEEIRQSLYRKAFSLCSPENLLFQRITMREMIFGDKYK